MEIREQLLGLEPPALFVEDQLPHISLKLLLVRSLLLASAKPPAARRAA